MTIRILAPVIRELTIRQIPHDGAVRKGIEVATQNYSDACIRKRKINPQALNWAKTGHPT